MAFVVTPYVIIAAVTASVALFVAFFAWRRRHAPGGAMLAGLMLSVAIWSAATACEYAALTASGKFFWAKVAYIGVLSSPVFYLLFALEYNRLERWLTRRTAAFLFAIPLATLLLAFTNDWHYLIWTEITLIPDANNLALYGHGPVFWLSVVGYSYLLMLLATGLFIRAALRLPGLFRRQVAMIIAAALAPWVVNALYVTGQSPLPGLELTPLVMAFTGVILAWAIFGFRLLTVAPVARQTLIETMAEGMVVLDADDQVVDINPAARQLVAAPPTFALGAPVDQLLPDWPEWDERYWRRGETAAEVAFGAADPHYLKVTVTPLRDRRGKLTGRLVTMHDITARRQAEAALREQNDYLKALQHTDMELVGQLELTSLLENIVRRAGQLVGTDSGYLDLVDPATGRLKPQVGIGALAESLDHPAAPGEGVAGVVWQSGQSLVVDDYDAWRGRIGDFTRGRLRAVVGVPLRVRDEVVGVLGLGYPADSPRTFTPERVELLTQFASLAAIAICNARLYAQVQREKLYFESLLANSPAATAIIDLEGRITSWNPAAEAVFGYSQAEAIGRCADDLVAANPAIAAEAQALTSRTMAEGSAQALTRRTRKDGALIEVELWAIPIRIDGSTVGAMAIYHDITELQQARRVAEAAARIKSEFLANMSHELRTPLNSILGFSELLARDPALTAEEQANVAIIGRSGEHLLGLINDVLDMARLEAGRTTLHESEFDLHQMFADLLDMFRLRAAAKGIDLRLVWTEPVTQVIYADERKLRQVLINLLGNAIKFTHSGAVTLAVEQIAGGADPRLVCTVQDTGPGIAPADQQPIFEPFVQGARTGGQSEGTGLGLPISRQFARLMGGDITMTSSGVPGEGSVFRLELPLRNLASAPEPQPPVNLPGRGAAPSPAPAPLEMPAGLAATWRAAASAAAQAADAPALYRLAAQVAADQPALAGALRGWIDAYDYAAIQQALEQPA